MGARAVSPKENERHLRSRPFGTLSRYRVRSYLPLCFRSFRLNRRVASLAIPRNHSLPLPIPYVSRGCTLPQDSPSFPPPPPQRAGAPPKPRRSCAKLGPFSHVGPSSLVFRIRSKKPIRNTPALGTPRLAPHTAPPWGARGSDSDLRAREWDPTGCYWFSSPAMAVVQIGVSSAREDDEEKSRQK